MPFQEFFAFLFGGRVIIKDVESIIILIFRIYPIAGKASAQPLLRSCMTAIERTIRRRLPARPSGRTGPDIAQPDGMPDLAFFVHDACPLCKKVSAAKPPRKNAPQGSSRTPLFSS